MIDGRGACVTLLSIDSMLHSWPREGLVQEPVYNIEYYLSKFINIANVRGEATNSGLGGPGSNQDIFCILSKNVVQKTLMFLHSVNNIEHNIKQNIYTGMEVISLIPL